MDLLGIAVSGEVDGVATGIQERAHGEPTDLVGALRLARVRELDDLVFVHAKEPAPVAQEMVDSLVAENLELTVGSGRENARVVGDQQPASMAAGEPRVEIPVVGWDEAPGLSASL